MNRRVIITESEKRDILNLHNQTNRLFEGDVVVTDWILHQSCAALGDFVDRQF